MRRKSWGIYGIMIVIVIVGLCLYVLSRASKYREHFTDARNYDVVVAQYNEDALWLLPYAKHVKLYIKSGEKNESALKLEKAGANISMLPNVGRESHTYLRYVIDNYDNLPDYVVFTQATINDHYDMKAFDSLVNLGDKLKSDIYRKSTETASWRVDEWKGKLIPADMTLGEFHTKYVKRDIPYPGFKIYSAAIFSVKSSEIRKRSKSEYEEMIKPLEVGNNPEIGHFFERSWYYIFS